MPGAVIASAAGFHRSCRQGVPRQSKGVRRATRATDLNSAIRVQKVPDPQVAQLLGRTTKAKRGRTPLPVVATSGSQSPFEARVGADHDSDDHRIGTAQQLPRDHSTTGPSQSPRSGACFLEAWARAEALDVHPLHRVGTVMHEWLPALSPAGNGRSKNSGRRTARLDDRHADEGRPARATPWRGFPPDAGHTRSRRMEHPLNDSAPPRRPE